MREWIAKVICLLALCIAAGFALLFAWRHNPAPPPPVSAFSPQPAPATEQPPSAALPAPALRSEIERGRELFQSRGCATCHSIAGTGNPRSPLDGVAARLQREELQDWITGTGAAAERLSTGVSRRKARYQSLPADELAALTAWLSTLHETGASNASPSE